MQNAYALQMEKIKRKIQENRDTVTLILELPEQKNFKFLAGQFMQVGLPGFGECPISISSNPRDSRKYFSLTIRAAGELTSKLISLKKGEYVYVRGPFGNGFPEVKKNLILIAGGCGFIPLRPVWEENRRRKDIKIQIFLGCANKNSLVFRRELAMLRKSGKLNVIFEKEEKELWSADVGLVIKLINKKELLPDADVFVCGPKQMYRPIGELLLDKGAKPADIYFSLEKRMHCGVGICQHCAVGTKYVCRDGPVFDYNFLKQAGYFN